MRRDRGGGDRGHQHIRHMMHLIRSLGHAQRKVINLGACHTRSQTTSV